MSVYFIQTGNAVKIGHSVNPWRRLAEFQSCSVEPLHLLTYIEGGRDVEQAIHRRFPDLRIRGELFRLAAKLQDYIASLPPHYSPESFESRLAATADGDRIYYGSPLEIAPSINIFLKRLLAAEKRGIMVLRNGTKRCSATQYMGQAAEASQFYRNRRKRH